MYTHICMYIFIFKCMFCICMCCIGGDTIWVWLKILEPHGWQHPNSHHPNNQTSSRNLWISTTTVRPAWSTKILRDKLRSSKILQDYKGLQFNFFTNQPRIGTKELNSESSARVWPGILEGRLHQVVILEWQNPQAVAWLGFFFRIMVPPSTDSRFTYIDLSRFIWLLCRGWWLWNPDESCSPNIGEFRTAV